MKAPAFQFYPGDWMKDPALRAVSLAARGLWMDLLCLMWESPIRGRLLHGAGGPITVDQLGRMCGCAGRQAERLVAELEGCGVCSRGQDGALESRRMIRDEAVRKVRAEGGLLGGNPTLKVIPKVRGKVGDKVNLPPNHAPTFTPTPSSSSSSTTTEGIERDLTDHAAPGTSFEAFWAFFIHAGVPLNDRDKEKALRLWLCCEPSEHEQILRWIAEQMQSTWTDAKHTPWPANALQSEGWKRTAAARTLPTPRQERIIPPLPRGTPRDISPEEAAETERKLAEAKAAGKFKVPNL